jgi:hypothetical protein
MKTEHSISRFAYPVGLLDLFREYAIHACVGIDALSIAFSLLYSESVESSASEQAATKLVFASEMRSMMR